MYLEPINFVAMKENQIQIYYNTYQWEELSESYKNLMDQSIAAQQNAYAPYSNFKVGAAILLEDGTIFTGNNQENAAYPSGLCAERVAIFACSAQYPNIKIKVIAICANSEKIDINTVLAPCGSCRQSMYEYESKQNSQIKVLLKGVDNEVVEFLSVEDLLPLVFQCDGLKKVR